MWVSLTLPGNPLKMAATRNLLLRMPTNCEHECSRCSTARSEVPKGSWQQ